MVYERCPVCRRVVAGPHWRRHLRSVGHVRLCEALAVEVLRVSEAKEKGGAGYGSSLRAGG